MTPAVNALTAAMLLWCGLSNPPFDAGFRSGLRATSGPNQKSLDFQTDAGDIQASLRVRFSDPGITAGDVQATINGRSLTPVPAAAPNRQGWIDILERDPSTGNLSKFVWNGQETVNIAAASPGAAALKVADWELYSEDGRDSKWLAIKRMAWKFGALLLAGFSLFVTLFLPEKPDRNAVTEQMCIQHIVSQVVGATEKETEELHRFLDMVAIQGAGVAEALRAVSKNPNAMAGKQFFFRARSLFVHRLDTFTNRLAYESNRLKTL
jgi:hypothetical protein